MVTDRTGPATGDVLRQAVGTRGRRWLLAVTLLLGVLAAAAAAVGTPAADRSFAVLADPVQSLMSVTVAFFGVLLVHDLRRASAPTRLTPTLLASAVLAAGIGVFGVLACVGALLLVPAAAGSDPWRHAGTSMVGAVLVQVVAQFVGTGLGMLIRSSVVACLVTLAPLGLWLILGAVDVLRPAQDWLVPYPTVRHLLSGDMSAVAWAQWGAVVLLWGVGLNMVGVARLRR